MYYKTKEIGKIKLKSNFIHERKTERYQQIYINVFHFTNIKRHDTSYTRYRTGTELDITKQAVKSARKYTFMYRTGVL